MREADENAVRDAILDGDGETLDGLFTLMYGELRRLARGHRLRWEGNETLNTTALVNEVYLKFMRSAGARWADRGHFCAVASRAMRQILITYAESRRAARRGGGAAHVEFSDVNPVTDAGADDLLALNEALERLSRLNERQARVVECRFFAGLSIQDTAAALAVSTATVERDWALARAWLLRELSERPVDCE